MRTGLRFEQPVPDTLLLSALVQPNQESHGLEAIAERLGITVMGRHTALGDAMVTAEVVPNLVLQQAHVSHTLGQAHDAAQKTMRARLQQRYGSAFEDIKAEGRLPARSGSSLRLLSSWRFGAAEAKPTRGWPTPFSQILIHSVGHPHIGFAGTGGALRQRTPCKTERGRVRRWWWTTARADGGVADGVNRNWLNGVGHPAGGPVRRV